MTLTDNWIALRLWVKDSRARLLGFKPWPPKYIYCGTKDIYLTFLYVSGFICKMRTANITFSGLKHIKYLELCLVYSKPEKGSEMGGGKRGGGKPMTYLRKKLNIPCE